MQTIPSTTHTARQSEYRERETPIYGHGCGENHDKA